ncbi:MAG TPA: phospholipid carrier-dependent glycosyltransferase, partial [candidate division Zixibacteria bacterium]|nr:phospholipid carrier-dependent glycosyltransferase [candidate division Zixibacteria bacterium]
MSSEKLDSLGSKRKFIIWAILLIGLFVRIYQIDWGLPAEYWADEDVILSYSAYIGVTKSLNPYTFGYSSLIFYVGTLIGFVDWVILNLAGANVDWDFLWSSYFADYTIIVLSARIFLASVGVLTVYLTYRIGEKVSEKVGLISALLVALSPLAIVETRRYSADGLMGLFTTLSLLFTIKFVDSNKSKDAILSSIFAGFALGTKYY